MLHLELKSFSKSHLNLAVVIQTSNPPDSCEIYNCQSTCTWITCCWVHPTPHVFQFTLVYIYFCLMAYLYCRCILHIMRTTCDMRWRIWGKYGNPSSVEGRHPAWCNAIQFQKFPPRAFSVAFEASHATCVTYEAYRSNWAKPPPPSSH